jgi:hypothetical protein
MQQDDRHWAHYYQDLFAALQEAVDRGNDVQALRDAVRAAPERKQHSFEVVGKGLAQALAKHRPVHIKRSGPALWQVPGSETEIRVRPHFIATLPKNVREAWFLNCKEEPFASPSANLVLHLMQVHGPADAHGAAPRLLNVRAGSSLTMRANVNRAQIEQSLAAEAQTYRTLWLANVEQAS